MANTRTGPDYLDQKSKKKKPLAKLRIKPSTKSKTKSGSTKSASMSDKDFKTLNKDMHDTAKSGGAASQETQNKYAVELARRKKNNKGGTFSVKTNKALK